MAHHPGQSTPTFRSRRDEPGSLDGSDIDHQQHQSPPSLPLFSSSSDHTITNSSTLSSKSGSSEDAGSATAANINNHNTVTPGAAFKVGAKRNSNRHNNRRKLYAQDTHNRALCKKALMQNDSMVYLDGPQVYTCGNCRTHLTSHDDIISKSFHGRHGRAYLFDQCVNITTGPAEDRFLITGLHSVSDIFCKRCQTLVGWTYAKAYEASQKYKEGKFIIEKINLHLEESDYYNVDRPAGERGDKFRTRSMSWGSERSMSVGSYGEATGSRSPSGVMFGSPTTGPLRGRSGSIGKGGSNSSYLHRTPLTPPTRRSPALAMMSPKSPRSPSDIIYEYRQGDD